MLPIAFLCFPAVSERIKLLVAVVVVVVEFPLGSKRFDSGHFNFGSSIDLLSIIGLGWIQAPRSCFLNAHVIVFFDAQH